MSQHTKIEQSKAYLKQALVDLLEEQPLYRISVSQLTRRAGVARGTFYLHYLDFDDFVRSVQEELLAPIASNLTQDLLKDPQSDQLVFLVTYVEANFDLFRVLVGENGDRAFEYRLLQLIEDFLFDGLVAKPEVRDLPVAYVRDFVVRGVTSIIYTWFSEGSPRTSQEILAIIGKTRGSSPYDLIKETYHVSPSGD